MAPKFQGVDFYDVDGLLAEEERAVRDTVRSWVDEHVLPIIGEHYLEGRFPKQLIPQMAALGLFGANLPEEYGCAGLNNVAYGLIMQELERGDSGLRSFASVQGALVMYPIYAFGSDEQKQRWLPRMASGEVIGCFGLTEPAVGSDATKLQATARRDGDGWVLDGRKTWISNGSISKLALVFANADPAQGHRGITAFLVDRERSPYGSQAIHGKLGLRSSDSSELILDGVRVPGDSVLGNVGEGFKIAMAALDSGRYSVAAGAVGQAQAAIDASVAYATQRRSFGKPIAGHQLVQELIADMVVETEAARLLVWRAGHMKDKGVPNTRETSIAKLYASEIAQRACDSAIQIHGGYGFSDEFPVERLWRDARVNRLYEGTTQIQKLIVGRFATGIDAIS